VLVWHGWGCLSVRRPRVPHLYPIRATTPFYGVYHSFSEKHLQRYVDEFSFRLNEGNVKNHTMIRIDSLLAKSVGVRIMYKELTQSA
jgi:hypothetical protein